MVPDAFRVIFYRPRSVEKTIAGAGGLRFTVRSPDVWRGHRGKPSSRSLSCDKESQSESGQTRDAAMVKHKVAWTSEMEGQDVDAW